MRTNESYKYSFDFVSDDYNKSVFIACNIEDNSIVANDISNGKVMHQFIGCTVISLFNPRMSILQLFF